MSHKIAVLFQCAIALLAVCADPTCGGAQNCDSKCRYRSHFKDGGGTCLTFAPETCWFCTNGDLCLPKDTDPTPNFSCELWREDAALRYRSTDGCDPVCPWMMGRDAETKPFTRDETSAAAYNKYTCVLPTSTDVPPVGEGSR